MSKTNILNNSDGILTVDYMFAIVLAMGFMIILFALSMTLTMVDVVQYMTFSTARVYSVANSDEETSIRNASEKFGELYEDPSVKPLFDKVKWFQVSAPFIGDASEQYPSSRPDRNTFYGASVRFQAKMLDFKIPFYGSTSSKDDGEGFTTSIHTFLGREPSTEECQRFNDKRLEWIIDKYSDHSQSAILRDSLQEYKKITDNGC